MDNLFHYRSKCLYDGGGNGTTAYTIDQNSDYMCPDKTGFTWQFNTGNYVSSKWGAPFHPAGEGLHVQCITDLEKQCQTVGGQSTGVPCIFPFKYGGISYETCIEYGGQPACATELDEDGNAINYGFCGPNCPLPGININ